MIKSLFSCLQKTYRNLHLQSKITLTHVVVLAVPMVLLIIFFYGTFYDMIVSNTVRQEQDASSATAPLIGDAISQVHQAADTIAAYLMERSGSDNLSNLNFLKDETERQALSSKAAALLLTKEELFQSIHLYLDTEAEDPIFFEQTDYSVLQPESRCKGSYWHGIFDGQRNLAKLLCPTFYLSPWENQNYGNLAYIVRYQNIVYDGSLHTLYLAVYFSQSFLDQVLKDNTTLNGGVTYLVNSRNNIAVTSDSALSSTYLFDYDSILEYFMSSNNYITKTVLNEEVYAGFNRIPDTDWFLVSVLPSTPIIKKSMEMIIRISATFLGGLLVSFFMATLLSHSITGRISSVIRQMEKVKSGPPKPMESEGIHDEVGDLIDTYNYMANQINKLIADQAKAAEDLRIAEFNSLQAQINPHFLYNTMDMINWQAKQGQTEDVSAAVQDLSRFYKLTLSRKDSISTIASEIEHVTIYVRLQNMRFQNGIELVVDLPDELLPYHIPKLTLQPVVENAILHGILEKEEKKGTILLTGWLEDGSIVLLISDDGVGISPEKLPTILSGEGNSSTGNNIAVSNTHRRLQILYGEEYGLSYESTLGEGTEVQIRIPAKK